MAFKGFGRGVPDKINSWHLPDRILRPFLRALTPLVDTEPSELDYDYDGLYFAVRVVDVDNEDHTYFFDLRLSRNDVDYWVADIKGFAVDDQDRTIWSSEVNL